MQAWECDTHLWGFLCARYCGMSCYAKGCFNNYLATAGNSFREFARVLKLETVG